MDWLRYGEKTLGFSMEEQPNVAVEIASKICYWKMDQSFQIRSPLVMLLFPIIEVFFSASPGYDLQQVIECITPVVTIEHHRMLIRPFR